MAQSGEFNIQVVDIVDNEDGSATMTIDMSRDALICFAKIGLTKALVDEAERVIKEHEGEVNYDNEYSKDSSNN
jgi:hypothetical protein